MMFTEIFVTLNWIYVQLNETDWKKIVQAWSVKEKKKQFPINALFIGRRMWYIFLNAKSCLKYQILGNKCGKIATFLLLELDIWKNIKVEGTGIYWTGCQEVVFKYVMTS